MTTPSLQEQINWLHGQVIYMQKNMPVALAAGKLSPEKAGVKLACAAAALETLITVRRAQKLVGAEEHQQ